MRDTCSLISEGPAPEPWVILWLVHCKSRPLRCPLPAPPVRLVLGAHGSVNSSCPLLILQFLQESLLPVARKPLFVSLLNPPGDRRALSGPVSHTAAFAEDEQKRRRKRRMTQEREHNSDPMCPVILEAGLWCICTPVLFLREWFIMENGGRCRGLASSWWRSGILCYVTFTLWPD